MPEAYRDRGRRACLSRSGAAAAAARTLLDVAAEEGGHLRLELLLVDGDLAEDAEGGVAELAAGVAEAVGDVADRDAELGGGIGVGGGLGDVVEVEELEDPEVLLLAAAGQLGAQPVD